MEYQILHIFLARQLQKFFQTLAIHLEGGTTLRILLHHREKHVRQYKDPTIGT